jgi:hypothetical protein
MEQTKSPYIRDIKPPAAAPAAPAPAAVDAPVKAEFVGNVPVKTQAGSAPENNPITAQPLAQSSQPAEADQDLDKILKDVNHDVKEQSSEATGKKSLLGLKKKAKVQSGPQAAKNRHVLPIALAVVAALVLVVAAFSAFKTGGA